MRVVKPARSRAFALAAVAATIVAWASAFPLVRVALAELEPVPLAAARFAIAALAVGVVLIWRRPPVPRPRHLLRFVACGLFGIAFYNVLLNTGQVTVSAGAASFIVNTLPIFTTLLAFAFLKERLGAIAWIGLFVSLAGIGLIASGQPGGLSYGSGAVLILGAALCSAVYFVVQRPLIPTYGAFACTAYTVLAGAMLLSPWLPEALPVVAEARPSVAAAVAGLGLVPAFLGYLTWTVALDHFGASRASGFLYLVPPTATLLAFAGLGEVPTTTTVVGGAIAVTGVVMINAGSLVFRRPRPGSAAPNHDQGRTSDTHAQEDPNGHTVPGTR